MYLLPLVTYFPVTAKAPLPLVYSFSSQCQVDFHNYSKDFIGFSKLFTTPTDVSYGIDGVENKLEAYLAWLRSVMKPYEDEVYADDDVFCERPPIGYETKDDYPERELELREWIRLHEEEGWTIEWYVA